MKFFKLHKIPFIIFLALAIPAIIGLLVLLVPPSGDSPLLLPFALYYLFIVLAPIGLAVKVFHMNYFGGDWSNIFALIIPAIVYIIVVFLILKISDKVFYKK